MLDRKTAAGTDLGFDPFRQRHGNARGNELPFPRTKRHLIFTRGDQIESARTIRVIFGEREALKMRKDFDGDIPFFEIV